MSKRTKAPMRYDELPDWLSVPVVARYYGIGRANAYLMVTKGLLPHRRLGRRIVVPRSAVAPIGAGEPVAKVSA
jgi:hypothetical protein